MPSATIELADIFKKQGKKAEALAAVKTALEQFPANKGLRRRYQELGGDPARLAAPPVAAPSGETPEVKAPEPSIKTEAAKGEAPRMESAPVGATQTMPQAIEPRIGNITNPWCRFCPDPAPTKDPVPPKSDTH